MEIKKNIDTIIFDYDGTLVDTNKLILDSWKYTFKEILDEEREESYIKSTFGEPLELTLKREFPNFDLEKALNIYRSYQKKHYLDDIILFDGMKGLIEKLKEQRYKLAVVTSRNRETTIAGLKKFGLIDYFDGVITSDDTLKHKPEPEPIIKALELLDSKRENSIMMGDSIFDIECSHNARLKFVWVAWAETKNIKDAKKGLRPDFIIEKPIDLFKILG